MLKFWWILARIWWARTNLEVINAWNRSITYLRSQNLILLSKCPLMIVFLEDRHRGNSLLKGLMSHKTCKHSFTPFPFQQPHHCSWTLRRVSLSLWVSKWGRKRRERGKGGESKGGWIGRSCRHHQATCLHMFCDGGPKSSGSYHGYLSPWEEKVLW